MLLKMKVDRYEQEKLTQLDVVNHSSVLFFSKDKANTMGKKLRPELGTLYLSSEVKDCIRFLEKIDPDSGSDSHVDLVIVEYDSTAVRLIDHINKSVTRSITSILANEPNPLKYSIIPTIALMNAEVNEHEATEHLKAVGGVTKVLKSPYSTSDLMNIIMEILSIRKKVDDAFRNASKNKVISSKYPHLPIFDNPQDFVNTTVKKKTQQISRDEGNGMSVVGGVSRTSMKRYEQEVKEFDEDTHCSSLLPQFMKDIRKENPDLLSPFQKNKQQMEQQSQDFEIGERQPFLLSSGSYSNPHPDIANIHVDTADLIMVDDDEITTDSFDQSENKSVQSNSNTFKEDAAARSRSSSIHNPVIEATSTDPAVISTLRYDDSLDNMSAASLLKRTLAYRESGTTTIGQEDQQEGRPKSNQKVHELLDPKSRPYWKAALSKKGVSRLNNYSIYPFIQRPRPVIQRPKTVGGMDKKYADAYWNKIHPSKKFNSHNSNNNSNNKLPDINKLLGAHAEVRHLDNHEELQQHLSQVLASGLAVDTSCHTIEELEQVPLGNPPKGLQRRNSNNTGTNSSLSHSKDSQLSTTKVERKLVSLALESATDLFVDQLLDVNFAERKINQGEKEMLSRGYHLELEGDRANAIATFTLAGIHSKDPQIAKMLLANLHYKSGELMLALRLYDSVVNILKAQPLVGSKILQLDEYLAYHNRGIINLRLGNDDKGVSDIEHALKAKPNDMSLLNLLSLVKRRMGSYQSAIGHAMSAKTIRADLRMEQELRSNLLEKKKIGYVLESQRASFNPDLHSSLLGILNSPSIGSRHHSLYKSDITTEGADSREDDQEDINARLMQTRGYVLSVDEPSCRNSLRDKVNESRIRSMGTGNGEASSERNSGGFLKQFKLNAGFGDDLFEDMFVKPSELQTALLVNPGERLTNDLRLIETTLRLFPIFGRSSSSKLQDLAQNIEYRVVTMKDVLFNQNEPAPAVCLLLSGQIQIRMGRVLENSSIDLGIGEVLPYGAFGHINFLFQTDDPIIRREVTEVLLDRVPSLVQTNSCAVVSAEETDREYDTSTQDQLEFDSMIFDEVTDRSIQPGLFKSYHIQSMCEMLFINHNYFQRVLMDIALEELKSRMDVIKSCKIFDKWTLLQRIRLARMGETRIFARNEVILQQGSKPNYLYLMMKGTCVVRMEPNRTELLIQKLNAVRAKALEHDEKYVFDHKLRHKLTMAQLDAEYRQHADNHKPTANGLYSEVDITLNDFKVNPDNILRQVYVTESELFRHKMQLEINKLEGLLQQAIVNDQIDKDHEDFKRRNNQSYLSTVATTNMSNSNTKDAEITHLHWPMLFGEACILDPENGKSRGSVVADTQCQIFVLHKTQVQTFLIDEEFLKSLKARSIVYPGAADVVLSLFRKEGWNTKKKEIVDQVPKDRWPGVKAKRPMPFKFHS